MNEYLNKLFNLKGKTVIMITHDHELAKRAKRIIRLKDGRVISQE